jgi:hypothetical protein
MQYLARTGIEVKTDLKEALRLLSDFLECFLKTILQGAPFSQRSCRELCFLILTIAIVRPLER